MCLTFAGRVQTRLIGWSSLISLTWIYATLSDKPDYWIIFWLMLGVGVLLDAAIYSWLIDYQPRWLTLLLAGLEFLLLKWIMEWPYPFEIRLRTRQALTFYCLGWLMIWVILYMILPRCYPRWVEDNGELVRFARFRRKISVRHSLARRRRIYGTALLSLVIAVLPWLVAYTLAPAGSVTTGLLFNDTAHLGSIGEAVAVLQGGNPHSLSGWLGQLARLGRWPVLPLYYSGWVMCAFALLLGLAARVNDGAWWQRLLIGVCLPWLPLPWVLLAAVVVWSGAMPPMRMVYRASVRRVLTAGLLLGSLFTWSSAWLGLSSARLLYVEQGTWQALIWLQQSVPPGGSVSAAPDVQPALAGLAGQVVAETDAVAMLRLTSGAACEQENVSFRHASTCVILLRPIKEAQ